MTRFFIRAFLGRGAVLAPGSTRFPYITWMLLLAVASLACSRVTTVARGALWLGPQTLILGAVGALFGFAIAWLAWVWVRSPQSGALDEFQLGPWQLVALLAAAFITPVLIQRIAFAGFANSADEYGFLFTANTLAHFRLWWPAPPDPALFTQQTLLIRDGRWVSQYLPGWPAIIALFEIVRLPLWLTAPVCGVGLLLVLWKALRLECSSNALSALLLLAYATTGFFLLNAATYYSHCISALAVMGTVLCLLFAERRSHAIWPIAAGACVGFALLCRVDSGALAAVAAFSAWLQQRAKPRLLLLGLVGFLPLLLAYGAYDWAITGVPFEPPTVWAGYVQFGTHGITGTDPAAGRFRMIVQTLWRTGELADTASLVIPALYVAALAWRARERHFRFYDVLPTANFIIFLIYPDLGGFQMGPRYWFDGFVAMHLSVGSAFGSRPVLSRRFAAACCILLVPVSLARLPEQIAFHAREMHERSTMFRLGGALPHGRGNIVLVTDFPSAWNHRANRTSLNLAKDFIRDPPDLGASVLYVRGDIPQAAEKACRAFPARNIFAFHLDSAHPDGVLVPVTCGRG
jgi:hypothetical protein